MRKKKRPKRKPNFEPGYSPIPLKVQQTIYRIHFIDKMERREKGFKRATRGLYQRLAKSFNVPHYTVERICCRVKDNEGRTIFRKLNVKLERQRLRNRKAKYANEN